MHESAAIRNILLDQNIPIAVSGWLKERLPNWSVHHVNELGFQGKSDEFIFIWAIENKAIIVTYDEDFADSRLYPLGSHHGVVRLCVWPTTVENTQIAMDRLISAIPPANWQNCLVIVENNKIRVRKLAPTSSAD